MSVNVIECLSILAGYPPSDIPMLGGEGGDTVDMHKVHFTTVMAGLPVEDLFF